MPPPEAARKPAASNAPDKLGELLIKSGRINQAQLQEALAGEPPLGEVPRDLGREGLLGHAPFERGDAAERRGVVGADAVQVDTQDELALVGVLSHAAAARPAPAPRSCGSPSAPR